MCIRDRIKARGGKVITVIAKGDEQVRKSSDYFIEVPVAYQPDYHWKISLYGSLHHSAGDVTDLCPFTYRTDYRTDVYKRQCNTCTKPFSGRFFCLSFML